MSAPDVDPEILAAMAEVDSTPDGLDPEALLLFARAAQRIRDEAVEAARTEERMRWWKSDLTTVVKGLVEALGVEAVIGDFVRYLVDAAGVEAVVATLVEAGVLVQPTFPSGKRLVASMCNDGEVGNVMWRPAEMAERYVPLYRIGGTDG